MTISKSEKTYPWGKPILGLAKPKLFSCQSLSTLTQFISEVYHMITCETWRMRVHSFRGARRGFTFFYLVRVPTVWWPEIFSVCKSRGLLDHRGASSRSVPSLRSMRPSSWSHSSKQRKPECKSSSWRRELSFLKRLLQSRQRWSRRTPHFSGNSASHVAHT